MLKFLRSIQLNITKYFFQIRLFKLKNHIGGNPEWVEKVPTEFYRIEGAWFVCFDKEVAPINNNCTVLSFGINSDCTFDVEMNKTFGCQVKSLDLFIEHELFSTIRKKVML